MRYMGGKSRIAHSLGLEIRARRAPWQAYWEPFVGAGWVLDKVRAGTRYASDYNHYLIAMWKALQEGWLPPMNVSEEEYHRINERREEYRPELVAFVGFGCSWGGKWFGGYARDNTDRNYAANARNSLLKKTRWMVDVRFFHGDFMGAEPPKANMLIYCDPPYAGTTGFSATGRWDPDPFWDHVRHLAGDGHTVLVSEYQAPEDFSCIAEFPTKTDMRTANGQDPRLERLFTHGRAKSLQGRLL